MTVLATIIMILKDSYHFVSAYIHITWEMLQVSTLGFILPTFFILLLRQTHTHTHTCRSACLKSQRRRKNLLETKGEENCYPVPREVLQSYPATERKLHIMLVKRKDIRGSLKETWDSRTLNHQWGLGLPLYNCRYNRTYCTKYYSAQVRDIGSQYMVNKVGR